MGKNHFSSKRGRGGGGGGRGRRDGGKGGRGGRGPYVDFRAPGYNDGKMTSLEESQVGINAFLSNEIQGFPGAIKQRYSDFIVREVDLQGKVVALTEVKRHVPATTRDQKAHEVFKHRLLGFLDDIYQSGEGNEKENKMNIPPSIYQIVKSLARRMLGLLNQNKRNGLVAQETKYFETLSKEIEVITSKETSQQLLQCLERIIQLNQNPQEEKQVTKEKEENDLTFFFPPIEDKTFRTKVHELLREYASTLVVSDTVANPNGVSVIRVRRLLQSGKKRKDIDQRSKKPWPTDRPDFLEFVLYKRNMETHSVMMQLAKAMSIKPANFTYAGTKDKRGITTQKCTIYRGNMERLEMLNRAGPELDTFNFLVGNARYVPEKLNLGDLKGNRFGMTIRSIPIDISHEQINHAVTNWAQKGFINYFGLQRFGTKSIPTHKIGLSILRHDFKRTVELLLDPQEGDASKIFEARQKFKETGNVDEALRTLPPYLVAEKAVLEGLKHHGTEAYAQAIQRIPRHLRMMYTHSYQSFVWNSVVNERLTKYPTDRCILGDLVIPADAAATWEEEDTTLNEDEDDQATSIEPESLSHKRRRLNEEIHVIEITLENIDHYSINDVVLPMPGYAIQYPKNHLKQLYEKILQNDGVDFEKLLKTTGAEYHLPGTFRHILRKPIDVQYEIKDYNDPSIPLMRTDVDILMEKDPPKSIPDGKYRALCLEFQLGSSSYATMALRELLKQSSSLSAQLKLNKDAEDISN